LTEYVATRRAQVDEALDRVLAARSDSPAIIVEAMRYSVFAGGKRFRPILTLAAAEAVSTDPDRAMALAMPAACAIEMIHTYSLIHDDLPAMDNDTLRRGQPTLHVVYGDGLAVLAGDALLAEAFVLLARQDDLDNTATRTLRSLRVIAEAAGAGGMVGGQAVDLQAADQIRGAPRLMLDADGLRGMHARKTGALIRAAAAAGAILADGSDAQIAAIDDYATELGLAFQIVDDVLDVEGARQQLGKSIGKDAAAGKPTYPAFFGIDDSRRLANDAATRAIAALEHVSIAGERLAEIARWVVSRSS
jgi:geranylgeranyl diphosphate synthase type II